MPQAATPGCVNQRTRGRQLQEYTPQRTWQGEVASGASVLHGDVAAQGDTRCYVAGRRRLSDSARHMR
jgi:hypothetical protein